jgi:hypothetical protein
MAFHLMVCMFSRQEDLIFISFKWYQPGGPIPKMAYQPIPKTFSVVVYGTNRDTLLDVRQLFDAPHGYPSCQLHPGTSQDLIAQLYLHMQHTYTHNI